MRDEIEVTKVDWQWVLLVKRFDTVPVLIKLSTGLLIQIVLKSVYDNTRCAVEAVIRIACTNIHSNAFSFRVRRVGRLRYIFHFDW
ncbi:hypothetical protein [Natronococcus roseus]|uniref:hypothetical protein n=1 Tax=Natronococcus roseus TaxID=1052014 RepID=UPI00374D082F